MKKFISILLCVGIMLSMVACGTTKSEHSDAASLAIIVSNKDFSVAEIDQIAIENGYDGYEDMVESLVDAGELYHIPAFSHNGSTYEETYTVKGTIVYEKAVEAGVIA